ncbi:MAG TPA: RhuM family protein [Candidatus Omnitrophota bacterium]|nr:RhuM family protein [Candidatus Omnitrophota bacterium]
MKQENKSFEKGAIAIYTAKDGKTRLEVSLSNDTVWLNQQQIAQLFGKDVRTVSEHLQNIFKLKELSRVATIRKFRIVQTEGKRQVTRSIEFFNLDVIISVGYRINSIRGTRFRIWATNVLRKHLIDGYTINEKRLKRQADKLQALQRTIRLIGSIKARKQLAYPEATGLLDVISDYSYALGLLDDYDHKRLTIAQTSKKEKFVLTYDFAIHAVRELKGKVKSPDLFGVEHDQSFKSSIASVYQTFSGNDLYPSIEEKAAHLLYFIVKNHSFIDGNKRIAASIFLWFLEKNGILYNGNGTKRIADNALVALTLMIAESKPSDRDVIVTLVVNLINRNN